MGRILCDGGLCEEAQIMNSLIRNPFSHLYRLFRVYLALAIFGASCVVVVQLASSFGGELSIKNIGALVFTTVAASALILIMTKLLIDEIKELRVRVHILLGDIGKTRHSSKENVSPDINPRLKKS